MTMHTSAADWRAANDCIGACHEARNVDELLSVLCPRLRQVFQADFVVWNTYAADMIVMTGYRMSPQLAVAHLYPAFLHYYHEHPLSPKFPTVLRQGHASFMSDHISLRALLRTGLWNEVYIHLYGKHQISVGGRVDTASFFTFGINRLGRDYTSRERELIRFMRPKIESLIQAAARTERTRRLADTLHEFFAHGDNAYAWVGGDGAFREISPEARRLLGASGTTLSENGVTSRAIMTALRRLHAPGRPRRFVGLRVGTLECLLLSLGANDDAILLLDPPAQPCTRTKTPLTRREAEVLHWLGDGKSNRDIGILCGISARTVGHHCENLFAKLGVESRYAAAMLARDYREE